MTASNPIQAGYAEFGACPHCRKNDGFLNLGKSHWFFCTQHKVKWCYGENVFSSWHEETQADWALNERTLSDFRIVTPYFRPLFANDN